MTPQELGQRRRDLCAAHGRRCYGVPAIARKLDISPWTLRRYEKAERTPPPDLLSFWAYVLGLEGYGG